MSALVSIFAALCVLAIYLVAVSNRANGRLLLVFLATWVAMASPAGATPFTMAVPNTSLTLPSTYPQAGGVAIVLEGTNGNVYYQFVNPSTMFQGYQNTGTPTAWQGNPFQIGPVMSLYCGPVVSCSSYLGGGITRMTVRFTAYDGDNQSGQFDFNDLSLRINGSNFGASSGNWSVVPTQNTNVTGTTLISSGTGYGNNTLDTGWFQSTDPAILSNVLSTGTITATVFDRDPNDNFWDFKQGNDAVTTTVPLNVAPGVTLDKASTTSSFATVGQIIPYTFTYRNIGSVWINNVSVSDPKVTGVVCPAPPAAGTANLDPGEQVICTANYAVTQADIDAGQILNTATATGTPQAGALGPVSDSNTIPGPPSSPAVDLTKSATPSPFGAAGSTLTYSFAVRNAGNVTLNNIVVTDPSLSSLSCTSTSIAPNVTVTLTCTGNTRTVTQANIDAGIIANTATVSARAPNGATVTDPSTITTPGPARTGGVALVKNASAIVDLDSNGPDAGDRINYSFVVSNTGNVTLTGISVSDPLLQAPNPVVPVSCPTTTLAPAASTTCTAAYTLTQANVNAGNVSNSAAVTGNPPSGVTGPVTDTSGTANNNDNPTVTPIAQTPRLALDKTSSTANYNDTNDTLSYSYLVTNTGNVTITNAVTIADDKATVTCPPLPGGDLIPGETMTCTATFDIDQIHIDAGGVTNIATANTTFGPSNTPVASASDQVTVPAIQTRSMTVVKTAVTPVTFQNPGDQITYNYVVTNTGNTTLTSAITVSDNRVPTVNCAPQPPSGLAPGASHTCSGIFTVTVDDLDVGTVTNIASASSGTITSPQTSVTVPAGLNPALTIDKTANVAAVNVAGDQIQYTFTVTNSGNATFTRTILVKDDKLGTVTCWVPPTAGPPADRVFTPAETLSCTANYTVTQADVDRGFVTNQAYADTTYGSGNIPVASPPDSVTVNATQNPGLTVLKSVTTLPITAVGQNLTYTIRVDNSGDTTLSNVTVSDPLIPTLSCTYPSMAPGAFQNCVGTYIVKQSDFDAGSIVNTATAAGSTPQGNPVTGNDGNTAPITQNHSVSIAKAFVSNADNDASGTVSLNDALTYRVTVTNDGNTTQTNVVVSDPLLTPSTQTCASVAPGATCILNGSLTVTQSQVNAGTVANTAGVTTTQLPTSENTSQSVPVPQISGLAIDKPAPVNGDQDGSGTVTLNDILTYTIVVTNTGNVTQTNVVVSDPQLTPNSNTCPSVDPGLTCTLIGTKTVLQTNVDAGTFANTASATSTRVTTPVTDSVSTPIAQNSSLAIAKSLTSNADQDSSGSVSKNDTLTYVVTVTNDGTVTQNNVVVSDPKLTPSSTTCATLDVGLTCVLTGTLTVLQADVDLGRIDNAATVTSTRLPTPETVAISTPIVQTRSVSIDKTGSPANFDSVGDVITYSYVLTNTGNVTLMGAVSVTDDKTTVSCPALPPAGVAPGGTHTCSATYTVTQQDLNAGSVVNVASGLMGTTVSPTDSATVPAVQLPALVVTKTSPTASFDAIGDVLTYNYVVRNTGNVTITNPVTVADNKTAVTCNSLPAGGLPPNGTVNCTATYTITQQSDIDAGNVTNVASASTTFGPGNTPVTSPTDDAVVPAVQNRSLSIDKSPTSVNFTDVGDVVSYQYVVTNTGNTTLTDALTVADNRVAPVTCPALPAGKLDPGASIICTASYTVLIEDLEIGSITNIATASSGTVTSPQDAVTVPNGANPALDIAKTASPSNFNVLGETITYTFVVRNSGDATFTRLIEVNDDKIGTIPCWTPTGTDVTFTPAIGATPAESVTCTANYTVTQQDLDRGYLTNQAFAETTYGAANIPVTSPPDTVRLEAVQNPELTVTKSVATLPITGAGQVLTYTITTRNTGDVTLTNVTVTDPLIPSLSCTYSTLAVGALENCVGTYTVTQANFDAGQIDNTATANGVTPQGNPVTDTGTITTMTAPASPAVTVDKAASPSTYQAVGETVNYAFTVTNSGNVTLSNLVVTDPLVPGFSCVIATLSPGDVDTSCATSHQIRQVDIDAGQIVNTATVTADAARGADPTDTGTATVTGPLREPAISLSKTGTPQTFTAVGNTVTYDYVVANVGNISFTGAVTIADDKLASVSCPALPVGGLLPGNSITCQATYSIVQADLNSGSIINTARASTATALGQLVSDPVSESVTANQAPAITVVKSAGAINDLDGNGDDAGDTILYTFVVRNPGNVTLTSIGVTDPKIGTVSCPVTTLNPTGSTSCTATYTLDQDDINLGRVTNTATASGTPPTGPAISDVSGSGVGNDTPTVTNISRTPVIAVIKTAGSVVDNDSNGADPGDTIDYSFTVSNEGNVTLTSIGVNDPKISSISCPVTSLLPRTSTVCTATYTLVQADINAGQVINTATATGTPPSGPAVTDESGSNTGEDQPTVTPIDQQPGIAVVKGAGPIADMDGNGPDAGDRIAYSFVVSNTGNVTLTSVGISDPKVGPVVCPATTIAPTTAITCNATYVLTQADINTGSVTNTATASGRTPGNTLISDQSGTGIGDNTPTVTTIPQSPALAVEKTSPTASFDAANDVLTYNYVVRNTGNVTITNPVTVTDDKTTVNCPALPAGGLLPGSTLNCSATYTTVQLDVDTGEVINTASANSIFGPSNSPVTSPTDQATVPAIQRPAMTVAKTATSVNFTNIGDLVTYEYVVANTGNTTLIGPFTVTDNRVSPVSCPTGDIAVGSTLICTATYALVLEDLEIGSVTNLASVSNGTTTSPQTSETVPFNATPALTVEKTSSTPPFGALGDTLTYNYVLRNTGGATFTRAIEIVDDKIGRLNCWTPTGADPTFVPAEQVNCSAAYVVTQADLDRGFVTNQAHAETTYGAANIAVASPPDNATVNAAQNPSLNVTKSVVTLPVSSVGQVLTYTIRVENNGNVSLRNVQAADPLIPSLSCNIPTLSVNAFSDCVGTYTVDQDDFDAGQIVNTATAGAVTPQGNPVSNTGGNTVTIAQRPDVALVKSAGSIVDLDSNGPDAGDEITYTFTVTNQGNVTLTNVAITDPKIGAVTCPTSLVAPGLSVVCEATYALDQDDVNAGEVINTATVTARAPDGSTVTDDSGSTIGDDDDTTTSIPSAPRIALIKSAAPISDLDGNGPDAGDRIDYTFTVTNSGNQTLTNLSVTDNLFTPSIVPCLANTLAPSISTTCSASYTLDQDDINAGNVTNTAVANGHAPSGAVVSDQSGSAANNNTPTLTNIPRVSALALLKSAGAVTDSDGNGVDEGDIVNYTFEVRNTGNQTLTNITVADDKATVSGGPLANLQPGITDSSTFTATYQLTQADVDSGNVQNTAIGRGNPPTGPPAVDTSGTGFDNDTPTDLALPASPALTLVKESGGVTDLDGNGPDVGDTISYTFTVRNRGNVTINNLAISDPLVGLAALEGSNDTATLVAMAATGFDPMATASTSKLVEPLLESEKSSLPAQLSQAIFGTAAVPQISTALNAKRSLVRLNAETRPLIAGDKVGVYFTVTNTGVGPLTGIMAEQDRTELMGSGIGLLAANQSEMLPAIFVYTITLEDVANGTLTIPGRLRFKARDVETVQAVDQPLKLADVQSSQDILTASISPVSFPSLAPGATTVFTGTYTLTQTDVDAGGVDNTAVVAGRTPNGTSVEDTSGTDETNDTATGTAIPRSPAVALVKTAGPINDLDGNGPDVEDTIAYSFVISNEGNVTLTSLVITDAKVGAVSCPQSTLAPASSITCGATYVLKQEDVDAGEVENTALVNGTAPGNSPVEDTSGSTIGDNTPTVTTIPRNGGVTLVKTAGTPTTNLGADATFTDADDTISYTFTLRNTGNVTLTPIAITDDKVPAITCPVNALAPNESTDCTGLYTLVQADFDLGSVENTARGTGTGPDGTVAEDVSGTDPGNNTPTTTSLPQTPRLTVVKTAGTPTTNLGANTTLVDADDTIEYSFAVVNSGNVTLTALEIIDDKVSPVSCPVTTLAPTETTTCTGTYVLTQVDLDAGGVENTATARATAPNGTTTEDVSGSDPTNDTPTQTSLPQVPLIAIVKTATAPNDLDDNGVDTGDTIAYRFAVTNQGNVTLTSVSVDDPLITGATPPGTVNCPAGPLAPATTVNCTATYVLTQANLDAGRVENQATATGTPPSGPPVTDNSDPETPGQGPGENDPTITSLTQTPGITVVKTANTSRLQALPQAGDIIEYIFTVKNTGNVTLTDIALSDPAPLVRLRTGNIPRLEPGQSDDVVFRAEYRITLTDTSAGVVVNSAAVTGNYRDEDGNPRTTTDTSGTQTDNDEPTRTPLLSRSGIDVVKRARFNDLGGARGANLGDTITYSFTVLNTGNVVLSNIRIRDDMLNNAGITVSCPGTPLNPGASMTCTAPDYPLTQADINSGQVRNEAVGSGNAVVDGQDVTVSDNSGSAAGNDDPTVIELPIPTPQLTKVASKGVVRIGDVVTFTIRAADVVFSPASLVDQLPGGLTYMPGSAQVKVDDDNNSATPTVGQAITPTVSGRRLTFSDLRADQFEIVGGVIEITLRAVVNASAKDGKMTNRAQLFHSDGRLMAEARATVDVRPDPVFDCGDIIGKVFDDANGNGIQDAETSPYVAERGIPGARVATVNGNLITTDKNGKFHIACADIPDAKIGSNFILKLDPRSLPSGYRLTTENPRVVRLTRGKMTKINFGASIARVVKLDLTDKVFTTDGVAVSPKLKSAILRLVEILDDEQSIVRLQYHLGGEGKAVAQRRLKLISEYISARWAEQGGRYKLPIETRLLHSQQGELQ